MFGFYKVSSAVPELKVADVEFNTEEIIKYIKFADKENAALIVFPELSLTGYTCADLFYQSTLHHAVEKSLKDILTISEKINIISIIGLPVRHNNALFNAAAIIYKGKILAVIPKTNLPNYREFYEKRWFTPASSDLTTATVNLLGQDIPFKTEIIIEYNNEFKIGVEICEDLWGIIPPSSVHTIAGATIIANLSASNELVGKSEYRKNLVQNQSAKCMCGYIYTSSGTGESSSDVVYGGHSIIAENGAVLKENARFSDKPDIIFSEIDCQRLNTQRISESSICDSMNYNSFLSEKLNNYTRIKIPIINQVKKISRYIDPLPFVPADDNNKSVRCTEIFNIQSSALAKRLKHINSKKSVIAISGGLDSTLALLVAKTAHERLNKPLNDIIAITMPGFGTTDRTYNNAVKMCKLIGCDFREIDIKEICNKQFKLLNIDHENHNTTYENVQARQRTMLLMNISNNEGGIVIGTGDLSEIALGWSTYNGDHMSMYSVNCGVPKTLIRYLIEWYANRSDSSLKHTLLDIIDTPVSPELLPPDKQGSISQKTEDIIGPYELHDFFLYHIIKYGAGPDKIFDLAKQAFSDKFKPDYIKKYLIMFIKRFFSQQFKRNCIPDGPKVGTIALSPRGDWRMPPDASYRIWLDKIE
ncbi:MAG TPA: NAD(+) synthase [Victivallales bacterium]|nr:NAD(+) synthase [Victivallales bacterium]